MDIVVKEQSEENYVQIEEELEELEELGELGELEGLEEEELEGSSPVVHK